MPAANTSKIAFCGMIAALASVIMLLGGIIPIATVALPAIAGCVIIPVVAELSEKHGFAVYAVVAVLSFFVTADREAMLLFVLFFGYYPILYSVLGKIRSKVLSYILKIVIFNVAVVADFFIATFVFMIPMGIVEDMSFWVIPALWLLANLVFLLYDFGMKDVIALYFSRIHPFARKFLKK